MPSLWLSEQHCTVAGVILGTGNEGTNNLSLLQPRTCCMGEDGGTAVMLYVTKPLTLRSPMKRMLDENRKLPLTFEKLIENRMKAINGLTFRNGGRGLIRFLFEGTGVIYHR